MPNSHFVESGEALGLPGAPVNETTWMMTRVVLEEIEVEGKSDTSMDPQQGLFSGRWWQKKLVFSATIASTKSRATQLFQAVCIFLYPDAPGELDEISR